MTSDHHLIQLCEPTLLPVKVVASLPVQIREAGREAAEKYIEFFTAHIRNENTRAAYHHAILRFFSWCQANNLNFLSTIRPFHVGTYIEALGGSASKPTVKQHLAAIRMLFDHLVVGQVTDSNPAHAVKGPRYQIHRGKTPVLTAVEARQLLDCIDTSTPIGLRDKAFISCMVYTFARVSAVVSIDMGDCYHQGKRLWLRLQEKGGKEHHLPAHRTLQETLDEYMQVLDLNDEQPALFRTVNGLTGQLTEQRLSRQDGWKIMRRRAKVAGIEAKIGNHTCRATGITTFLQNGGILEKAKQIAAHSSVRTTMLYDRRIDEVTLTEMERVVI